MQTRILAAFASSSRPAVSVRRLRRMVGASYRDGEAFALALNALLDDGTVKAIRAYSTDYVYDDDDGCLVTLYTLVS